MINSIIGHIQAMHDNQLIVMVGPLGLSLSVPDSSSFQVGNQVTLHTYLHWNQEQGPSLFGFISDLERTVFVLIISCSGIGPKIGLAVLAELGVERFLQAIHEEDEKALSKVNGIGAKKAEQMIVLLKHKVVKLLKSGVVIGENGQFQQWNNVIQVLESLNYSRSEISASMNYLKDQHAGVMMPFDQMVRNALSFLAKKG